MFDNFSAMLPKAQVDSASDIAARELFDAIVDGRIPPGSPLRLKELSEQLGMSMMPVREAIRRLAALDLVEMEPRKGARVRERTLADLQDTYFSRLHLETIAVWEAAQHFTADDGARAATALAEMDAAVSADDRVAARDAHERFHFAIYGASRRDWLIRSLVPAWRNSERYRVEWMRQDDSKAQRDHEHASVLAALLCGDGPDAVRWLRQHLNASVSMAADKLAGEMGQTPAEVAMPKLGELMSGLDFSHLGPDALAPLPDLS
jgi:DNA-binding GntR family transcriptional regulator